MAKASFRPSEATTGGFLDDCDGEIIGAELVDDFNYAGEQALEADLLAAKITYDSEDLEEPWSQHYSLGNKARNSFTIGEDGSLVPLTEHARLNRNCSFILWTDALVNAGYPEDLLDEPNPKQFIGLRGHLSQQPRPRMPGIDMEGKTVLVFTEIDADTVGLELKKGKRKRAAKGKAKSKAAQEAPWKEDDITAKAQELVMQVLADNGDNPVATKSLAAAVFKLASSDRSASGMRTQIVKLMSDEDFLAEGPWNYDKKKEQLVSA